ncbi:Glycosyltransferase Gtf1 [bioreactor metagenome]|uniref:Glycosyltransferase Gtf1 n=1 Tax=bioreactor metagenome TaxID=1076179 RepID=A0A644Y7R8_9ZZZZ
MIGGTDLKICLIAEGCYPYIVGGVSSWVQQLIRNFPEHEYVLYTIMPDSSKKGKFLYNLPANVSGTKEIFLNDVSLKSEKGSGKIPKATITAKWEIDEIRRLMMSNLDQWNMIFDFFQRSDHMIRNFLLGSDFYDIISEVYRKQYADTRFVDFVWTMRSMYMTLFHVLNNPPPKADLYHSVSTGYAGIAGAMAKHLYGGRLLITEHGIYSREREEEIITAAWVQKSFKKLWIEYFKSLSLGAYRAADRLIALFDTNRRIQIELGADPMQCEVISNGVNVEGFSNLPGKTDAESQYLNVGAVIRVTPIKDIKTMLYAFDIVKRQVPNAHFYLIGPTDEAPEYFQECQSLAQELNIGDLQFTGRVNVKEYIGRMDVMVLTSISEGQPLALMEAMAAGVPCVSTNVGSCKELFNGKQGDSLGLAGLLAPIMDYEQIAEHIVKILTTPDLKKILGETGRKRMIQFYSEQRFAEAYRRLYDELDPTKEGKTPWPV